MAVGSLATFISLETFIPSHVVTVSLTARVASTFELGLRVKVGVFLQNVIYVCNLQ